ncbi:alpha-galactosidase A precursor [Penicillium alfredii]|uniref:Alpha-galactosidase A n=1 Tax=Penicillium alfredii TaxID=1506179 RepID=A0A9W9KFT8_9EURO|nr:alpha-galactosidase A precursor [Penicillium alfredii]KAJ5104924.1 alpha-galactosidase A precursor [Penicillium alfredii]
MAIFPATRQRQTRHFATALKIDLDLAGITDRWHPVQVDHLELSVEHELRSNIFEATCGRFDSAVIVKFARFPWEMPYFEAETTAYKWIQGHDVGPDFLGHLTEEGPVIGLLVAHITPSRHATPEGLDICSLSLSKLHQLGIKHRDINKHNFLVHNGKQPSLIVKTHLGSPAQMY